MEVIYYILLPYVFIGYAFKGQVHVFAGQVKIVVTHLMGQVQY